MSKLDRLQWEFSSLAARFRLNGKGVQLGPRSRFLGQPIVTLHANSRIAIGARFVGVSRSEGTALGVRAPLILRTLAPSATISIGDDVGMSGTVVCAAVNVTIGSRCLIGADCMIFDTDFHNHAPGGNGEPYRRYSPPNWEVISTPVYIGDDVFLGARSIVTKGVTIGAGSIVAAGSVITKDIPPRTIAAGSPARVVRSLD